VLLYLQWLKRREKNALYEALEKLKAGNGCLKLPIGLMQ
jgi:hypothetical protein